MNGTELSPWAGMDACTATETLFVDDGATDSNTDCQTMINACQVTLAQASGTTTTIRVTASSNGPGGSDSGNAEMLKCKVVSSE
jgi:hypothetical protein